MMSLPLGEELVEPVEDLVMRNVFVEYGSHLVRASGHCRCRNDGASARPASLLSVVPDSGDGMTLGAGSGNRGRGDIVFEAVSN